MKGLLIGCCSAFALSCGSSPVELGFASVIAIVSVRSMSALGAEAESFTVSF